MGAFEDKLLDAGLPQGGVTPDEQYKQAVMPIAPMNTNPLPVIGPPTAEQVAAQQAVENQIYGWMPKISRYAGVQLPASSLPPPPKPMGGPVAPKAKPEPGEEDTWQYRFMGRPPTKEELAADKAEAAKLAQQIKHETKYFRPELAQVPQKEFDKNTALMRKLGAIQEEKANIEAAKLHNESMLVQQQADMLQRNAAEAEQRDKVFFEQASAKQREIDKKVQEVGDYKYNPRRVISDAGTLEKMGMIAGAMLGGWQQAMTKSGENQFLKAMDKIVQDEADRQEHEFGQKRYMANEAVNSYQRLMQDYKDRDVVRNVRKTQIYKAMQTQIMSQALASGSATAVKNAEEANAAMDLRIQQNEMQRWQSMYHNPDLVRGGGGGAKQKKIEEGAKFISEKELTENLPAYRQAIQAAKTSYEPGSPGAEQGSLGDWIYQKSPWVYRHLVPGTTQEDVSAKQDYNNAVNMYIKTYMGAASEGDRDAARKALQGDGSAEAMRHGIEIMSQGAEAVGNTINKAVESESRNLAEQRGKQTGGTKINPYPSMPNSTKKAGQ